MAFLYPEFFKIFIDVFKISLSSLASFLEEKISIPIWLIRTFLLLYDFLKAFPE